MLSWVAEYPVSSALFLVVLYCLFQSWFFKKDFFSPPSVYCFSQCITLGIAYFQLDYAMTDFTIAHIIFSTTSVSANMSPLFNICT